MRRRHRPCTLHTRSLHRSTHGRRKTSTSGSTNTTCDISPQCTLYIVHRCSKRVSEWVSKVRFTLPEFTARVHGCQKCTGVHGPSTRVHFLTPVNSGRQLGFQKMHPSSRAVNSAREIGPWTRVVETGLKQTLMFYSTHSSSFRNSVNTFCWLKVSKHSNWMKQTAATTDQWLLGQSDTSNSLWSVLELTIVVPYVHIHNKFFKISDFPPNVTYELYVL